MPNPSVATSPFHPLALLATSALLALACGRDAADPPSAPAPDAVAPPPAPKPATGRYNRAHPKLGAVLANDLTPHDLKPKDFSLAADVALRAALLADGRFLPATEDDADACKADVDVYYAILVNNVPVVAAKSGLARVALDGKVYCPDGGELATFATEFGDEASFGSDRGGTATGSIQELLTRLADRAADAFYGQAHMHGADDAAVVGALAESKRVGVLMEAAAQAGERKLEAAVPHLVRLTGHEEDLVVLRSGAALGLIGHSSREVLRALARMTDGPAMERHLVAVNSLGDIGGPEAARYLDTIAVGDPMPEIRELARMAARRARGLPEQPLPPTPEADARP